MRLRTRLHELERRQPDGCRVCGTGGAVRFVVREHDPATRGDGAVRYERCPACRQRRVAWFTIAIDRVGSEGGEDAGATDDPA